MKENLKAAIPAMIILFMLYACVGFVDYSEQAKQKAAQVKK